MRQVARFYLSALAWRAAPGHKGPVSGERQFALFFFGSLPRQRVTAYHWSGLLHPSDQMHHFETEFHPFQGTSALGNSHASHQIRTIRARYFLRPLHRADLLRLDRL